MDVQTSWTRALERPAEAFLEAAAARLLMPEGPRDASREALRFLLPRVAWEGYHPHLPMGLPGLRAVWRLRQVLAPESFLRALATQLHMLAHEGRDGRLARLSPGIGDLANLDMAVADHHATLAWAEAQGLDKVEAAHFDRLLPAVRRDMSHLGHKALFLFHGRDLHAALGEPKASGRRLLGVGAWMAAKEPVDTFWAQRALRRLEGVGAPPLEPARLSMAEHQTLADDICDLGLVALLDAWGAHVRAGLGTGDLLAALVLAASHKVRDARRDLEGKTLWTLHHLATLACFMEGRTEAITWLQAAALVNLFPSEEPETRLCPRRPRDPGTTLLDAVLDAEPQEALHLAMEAEPDECVRSLAESATRNDPVFNHASQVMGVASLLDLMDRVPPGVAHHLRVSVAKSLANAQGSSDLGLRADRAISALHPGPVPGI